jgi:hypothetical protein
MESVGEEEGKKEATKKSKKQKRKERDETVGGIRLNEQAAAALSEAHSIELQLETLASHCRLGNTTAEDQLSLAWQLQAKFRRLLPSCVVVPFGAPFSGHGTVSSDCDLSLLSNPSPLELSLFIGPAYLPSHLHSAWDRLQTTRPMPAVEGESQQAGEVGMKEILAVLLADPSYSAVWAVPSARVPIIQFMSGQLHCDLSLNNRLGPANTRLLGAYMNFDPRMAVLVPCVRLWVRGWSLGRRLLNNYAMSLMLIQCLQHTTPPVLPCLQVTASLTLILSTISPFPPHRSQGCGLGTWPGLAVEVCQWSSQSHWVVVTAHLLTLAPSCLPPILPLQHNCCCTFSSISQRNSHFLSTWLPSTQPPLSPFLEKNRSQSSESLLFACRIHLNVSTM